MKISFNRNFYKIFTQVFETKPNFNYLRVIQQQRANRIIKSKSQNNFCISSQTNILRKNSESSITNQKYLIQFVPQRQYSKTLDALILGEVGPFVSIILGRVLQNGWKNLSSNEKRKIAEWFSERKSIYLFPLSLIIVSLHQIYNRSYEETPFTKRKRLVLFSKEDYEPISQMLFKISYNTYKNRILSINHRTSQRINKIIQKLLESNEKFEEIRNKNWSVFVIKDPKVENAFVLPTGQIFVYTGIISMCDNDSQLAGVLAHELSHTLLEHGKEQLSHNVLNGLVLIIMNLIIWTKFKPIKALLTSVISSLFLKFYYILPLKHLNEIEADFVGLYMTANACYDVRESSAFWRKMAALETVDNKNMFSTHPSNTKRYQYLDSYMNQMIEYMECHNCPKLSEIDPREEIGNKYSKAIKAAIVKRSSDKSSNNSKKNN